MALNVKMEEKAAMAALASMNITLQSAKMNHAERTDETVVRTKQAVMSILKALKEQGHESLAAAIATSFEGVW